MKSRQLIAAASAVLCSGLFCESASYAALINVDLASPGDKLLVEDSRTGLEWLTMPPTRLDLQHSEGVPPDQILAGYGGFIADGFQFATGAQVKQLFQDAGITDFTGVSGAADVAGAKLLLSLFGNIDADPHVRVVQGFADVNVGAGAAELPYVEVIPADTQYNETANDVASANCVTTSPNCTVGLDTGVGTGDWLVRDVTPGVPEPSTWATMLVGFAGLAFAGYRRTKRKSGVAVTVN